MNGRIYVVERVRDVKPARPNATCPPGWLSVTLDGYDRTRDAGAAIRLFVAPQADDPTTPDWSSLVA